jgi:hypothetical protein
MVGTINSPEVKTDMDSVVDMAATNLKKEVNEFVNAKLDSARQELHHPSAKKQLFVQASFKTNSKAKKTSKSLHKKTTHTKAKKKHRKSGKNYSTSLKKSKSVASTR